MFKVYKKEIEVAGKKISIKIDRTEWNEMNETKWK